MELVRLIFDEHWNLQLTLSLWVVMLILLPVAAWLLYVKISSGITRKTFEFNEAEIGIGTQKIKIKPNYDDIQIAYKLWIELSTRKIGLPIDFDNDVLIEIYSSWYEFFQITRDLIKSLPVQRVRKYESTREIVRISIDVLNEGIRPHLTQWQARFRRWYEHEADKAELRGVAPQQLQKEFPEFKRMVDDMKDVNARLIKYRESLRDIAIPKTT